MSNKTKAPQPPVFDNFDLNSVLATMQVAVERFNADILSLPVATKSAPTPLSGHRKQWAAHALSEEVQEFQESSDIHGQADALLDLIYFAMGRLYEMGVPMVELFKEIHQANMSKVRGELAKRPGAKGYDAIKPEGWRAPAGKAIDELASLSPVLREVSALRASKGNDYNSRVQLEDYFPFGEVSYAHMVHLKALRMLSIIDVMQQGKPLNHEGLYDTLLDLINYTTFFAEFVKGKQPDVKAR